MRAAKTLLWLDSAGGLVVGALVLAFSQWLSDRYEIPVGFVLEVVVVGGLAVGAGLPGA